MPAQNATASNEASGAPEEGAGSEGAADRRVGRWDGAGAGLGLRDAAGAPSVSVGAEGAAVGRGGTAAGWGVGGDDGGAVGGATGELVGSSVLGREGGAVGASEGVAVTAAEGLTVLGTGTGTPVSDVISTATVLPAWEGASVGVGVAAADPLEGTTPKPPSDVSAPLWMRLVRSAAAGAGSETVTVTLPAATLTFTAAASRPNMAAMSAVMRDTAAASKSEIEPARLTVTTAVGEVASVGATDGTRDVGAAEG